MKQKKVRNRGKSTMPIQSMYRLMGQTRLQQKTGNFGRMQEQAPLNCRLQTKKNKPKTAIRWKEEENQIKEAKTQKRE